jgi:hypothetical protein
MALRTSPHPERSAAGAQSKDAPSNSSIPMLAFYGVLVLALAAPFFLFDTIPLDDLPNHIAREEIVFGDGAIGAEAYYAAQWRLVPNLALDGWVFLLHRFVPVDLAIRLFLAATAAQLVLGTLALNRAVCGSRPGIAYAAGLFVYTRPLLLGFVNDCFGVGMTLWAFALWLRWRRRRALVPVLGAIACLILLAHLLAFGVYAVAVAAYGAGEIWRTRRRGAIADAAWQLAHLALPLGLAAAILPSAGPWRPDIVWDGVYGKLVALGSLAGLSGIVFEAVFLWLVIGLALALRRRIVVARAMIPPLAALALAFLVLPQTLGQGTLIDYRLPPCVMLFLIASSAWRKADDPWRGRALLCVAVLVALRLGALANDWAAAQPVFAQYRAAFAMLPRGAKLLPLGLALDRIDPRERPLLGHVAALAVSERGAFIPTLFAGHAHELLIYKPPYDALATMTPSAADAPAYDYVLIVHPERLEPAALPAYTPIASGDSFVLGRLVH